MTRVGFVAGVAAIAVASWLALPVVALVAIVRDKLERLDSFLSEGGSWT